MADRLEQEALFGHAEIDERAAFPTLRKTTAVVQPQASLGLIRAVAFVTVHHQHRSHPRFEKSHAIRLRRGSVHGKR